MPPISSERMFLLAKPDQQAVRAFLESQRGISFSYAEVGASRAAAPPGYNIDHNRIRLGYGREAFNKAIDAIKDWKMFGFDWIEIFPRRPAIEAGMTVAVLVRHLGFYSLNASRIVYTMDSSDSNVSYGFAYGTLFDHAEQGEERFTVAYEPSDNAVWYDLFAFSRPRHPLARAGYPLSRFLQRRFAQASLRAMFSAANK